MSVVLIFGEAVGYPSLFEGFGGREALDIPLRKRYWHEVYGWFRSSICCRLDREVIEGLKSGSFASVTRSVLSVFCLIGKQFKSRDQ